ncbi:retrovirus-related pol polyprotein from transposon TNT 1-94 [Tanacetum coccineum]
MKVEESLNVTFDKTVPPPKTSPLEDDDLVEEQAIEVSKTKPLRHDLEDKSLENNEITNIKESKSHPLENVIEIPGGIGKVPIDPIQQHYAYPYEDDDLVEEEAIEVSKTRTLGNDLKDKSLENNEIINIKESKSHPLENVIEPKNINEALKDESWVIAMQEELNQFISNDVWELVPNPKNMTIIGTKWVYRNKLDENGVVSRNKARLVAQGYNQQEGIDYDETYAPVARLESIRILLAYACALDFRLFQMDVKSAFLNGFINEEVYVAQPPGFIDFAKPNHVYRLKKALYGLKQAPKAWYDRLKAFLIKHDYTMGMVDNTLFTKKKDSNIIIVQIYVDDIIFGSTCQEMCDDFAKIMHDEFEMSMMGELNFFLGLQIKQLEDVSSPYKPLPKPLRVAKMSVRPTWRKKLNHYNSSNEVDVNLPTPIPKPQSPINEPSQANTPTTHSNHVSLQSHSLPLSDSCGTNVGQASIPPQSVNQSQLIQPQFPHLLINPHVASMLHA